MREVLSSLLIHWLQPAQRFPPEHAFHQFKQILMRGAAPQDGSSFALNDSLRKTFPGRFKTISPAAVELHVTMDLLADQPCRVELTADTHRERACLPDVDQLTGCLLLLDRGYFDLDWFECLKDAGGFYIARGKNTINPNVVSARREDGKLLKALQGKSLKAVKPQLPKRQRTELDVAWIKDGKKIQVRLIAFWDKQEKRFTWLTTNLPSEQFSLEDISEAYRLRWQIELLFKEWKSYANLHRYDTDKAPVAEGLIWAAIAAALVKRFICHSTQRIMGKVISSRKTAMSCTLLFCQMMSSLMRQNRKKMRHYARQLMIFLGNLAHRAHPKRDRVSGKFRLGLEPCEVA